MIISEFARASACASMKIKPFWILLSLFLAFGLVSNGCGDDDDDMDDDTSNGPGECKFGGGPGDIIKDWPGEISTHNGEIGDFCRIMEDCKSQFCVSYQDSPPDPDATCQEAPSSGLLLTGTLRDFETKAIIPSATVDIIGGLEMVQNPTGPPIAQVTTDEQGRFEYSGGSELTRKQGAIGARVELPGYVLSATGLVRPEWNNSYPLGTRGHDIFAVSETLVASWNALLKDATCIPQMLIPLVERGGAFGMLRDADTGEPPSKPVVLRSQESNPTSVVRYLNDDGTAFVDTQSNTTNGFFVILTDQDMELFDAYRDGKRLNKFSCRVGKASTGAGVVSIGVDIDEW